MHKILTAATMGLALAGSSFAFVSQAEAQTRARSVSVQGAYGRGCPPSAPMAQI